MPTHVTTASLRSHTLPAASFQPPLRVPRFHAVGLRHGYGAGARQGAAAVARGELGGGSPCPAQFCPRVWECRYPLNPAAR